MNNILIIYNGWKIKKFKEGFAVVLYNNAGNEIIGSNFKKKLKDIFFFCDSIDFKINIDKIEGRYKA